jgi:hypothetical protein
MGDEIPKRAPGKPSPYEGREAEVMAHICSELCKAKPLTLICQEEGMPDIDTVYVWLQKDEKLASSFARARVAGWDALALETLQIADDIANDTIKTKDGEIPDKEWILRSKLRVDTRLKLLAKWDPKRYGEMVEKTGTTVNVAVGVNVVTEEARRKFIEDKKRANAFLKRQKEDETALSQ